jgi:lysophospholipase L1-like esterase
VPRRRHKLMATRSALRIVPILLALALAARASAAAADTMSLVADRDDLGYVSLTLHASPGTPVAIDELVAGGAERVADLVPAAPDTRLPRVVQWRCDRLMRRFVATAADGARASAAVRTPGCDRRLKLAAPARVRPGRRVAVRLTDRWQLGGVAGRFCVKPPGGPRACHTLRLGPAPRTQRFRALRPGAWRIRVHVPWGNEVRDVHARRRRGRLRVLATGDSMIQGIDHALERRLAPRGGRVRSDAHISTGISKPSMLNWPAHARAQASGMRPDVTVMFLGANDGFPMGGAPCCGAAWVDEYARRVGRMIHAYARGGRGRVYWLLLPAPRRGVFRTTFPAVNAALRRAVARAPRDARLIRLPRVFTPGWRYRDSMRIDGRLVRVRQADGVHLNGAGQAKAAAVVVRALRRERILR